MLLESSSTTVVAWRSCCCEANRATKPSGAQAKRSPGRWARVFREAGVMRHRVNAFLGAAGYGIELVQEGPCSIERRDRRPVARALALRFSR
ncbi:TPA: hypothetical protein L6A07_34680 [Pseudomonas aeruginosa]|nr:hypothetical protein G039_0319925 [Pseudomonas aeruginosa VRFPA01]HBP5363721.1 hypothetical protein [Pseudomonas aeruginosa]HBP6380287.1 hypothetical protein [Pseudomonas aeruginosa]HBP6849675.1 hypothetical protein [Pseudomonas aeruginosa]